MDNFRDIEEYSLSEDYDDGLELASNEDYLYYADNFDPDMVLQAKLQQFSLRDELTNLVVNCMSAVGMQSFIQIRLLLLLCLIFRIFTLWFHSSFLWIPHSVRVNVVHTLGGINAFLILYDLNPFHFPTTVKIVVLYIVLSYTTLILTNKALGKFGSLISFVTVIFIFSGELLLSSPKQWHQIRGVVLVLAMKVISLAFDLDRRVETKLPDVFTFVGYLLHNGTFLFGPWLSLSLYKDSISNPKPISVGCIYYIFKSLFQAFVCLLLSTCIFSYLFIDATQPDLPAILPLVPNYWMFGYQSALSFHFSHYYISYLAQAICMLSGTVGTNKNLWSNFVISKPFDIEIPTSMLNVVVAWNIPMSQWLKTYIFDTYIYMGRPAAILLTYTASAILHGLSFHLAAILLSLAFYTYVEYELRKKLAHTFQCTYIEARPKPSPHEGYRPWWAYFFNFAWIIINLMHLAYLGSMFQSDDDLEAEGYAMKHTLHRWSRLGFFSHGFALACFIFNRLI